MTTLLTLILASVIVAATNAADTGMFPKELAQMNEEALLSFFGRAGVYMTSERGRANDEYANYTTLSFLVTVRVPTLEVEK